MKRTHKNSLVSYCYASTKSYINNTVTDFSIQATLGKKWVKIKIDEQLQATELMPTYPDFRFSYPYRQSIT